MSSKTEIDLHDLQQDIDNLRIMLEQITSVVKDIQTYQWHGNDHWMSIDDLRDYIPGHPAKQTLYGWLNKYDIPAYHVPGMSKHLMFLQSEIDEWLLKNRITSNEITDKKRKTSINSDINGFQEA